MDERTKRQKMEAMALQTAASPREAEIAQTWLDAHPRRTLSRDDIFAAPDVRTEVASVRVFHPAMRVVVVMDADDPVFMERVFGTADDWDGRD